jgi:DNA polymerase/3'-5' exonuclease PolX
MNKEISQIFEKMIRLLEIKGDKALSYKIKAYKNAINILNNLKVDISEIYNEKGLKGIRELGIGEKNAKKIEEYINKQKIKEFEELNEETAIQNIIAFYFQSKGLGLQELKENAKKRKIIYSRFTKPAKQLLDLAGSVEKAEEAINKVAQWAKTRKLDYAIETVFKKWLELDNLKPKEVVKKPFYRGDPMIWSETKKKWFVISKYGEWLEFADKESTIEWRIIE